jgi:hypothetical protein
VGALSIWIASGTWLLGLAANGALLLGSCWIARFGLRQPRVLPCALAAAVIFWAACTLGVEALGAIGAIAVDPMVAWGLLILGAGGVVHWLRMRIGSDRPGVEPEANCSLSWDALLGLAGVLSAASFFGMRSLLLAVKVVSDGPIYHLYFAARWWKAGRLCLLAAPFGENAATYFPANGDLWFTWLLASWGGDRLARVGQAPFLVLAGLASFACARLLGASRSASLVATCWFVSSTPLLIYSFEPNVDTIFVAGYLLAAYFFLRAWRARGGTAALFLGALAAGGALGTKAVGVVFIPPLLLLAMAGILVQPAPMHARIARALAIAVVPLVSGGYWFIRNTILTGNPLYPLEIRLWGHTILHGWYGPEAMRSSEYYLPFSDWRALGDILFMVLDPRLAPLWIGSLIAAWASRNLGSAENRAAIRIFALMAVLNVVAYWVCIPYRTQQRFMLQALGLAVVPLSVTLDRRRWLRHLAVFLLGIHLLTPQNWPFPPQRIPWDQSPLIPSAVSAPIFPDGETSISLLNLVLVVAIEVAALVMVWSWSRIPGRSSRLGARARPAGAAAVFLLLAYLEVWSAVKDPRVEFYPPFPDFFAGWHNLEARSGAAGSRVAYAGTDIPYYLLGKGLRNDVRYVNIDRHRDWLMHDYRREARARGQGTWPNSRPGWDRIRPDYQAWVENLEAEGIQLLVVTRQDPAEGMHNIADSENFPIERRWADSHTDRFEPLYGAAEKDPWFRLYRFRQARSSRG